MKRFINTLTRIIIWWTIWLFCLPKIRHESAEHRQSTAAFSGPAIIVTNHNNFMDYILFMYLFLFRYVRCIVGKTLYESSKGMTLLLSSLGAIKVDRFSFDMDFFFRSMSFLKKKGVLLIFPEGKLSADGEIDKFKGSAALLAVQSGADIIPVYHTANYRFMSPIKVMVGDRINLREKCTSPNPSEKELSELTTVLENKVKELKTLCESGGGVR